MQWIRTKDRLPEAKEKSCSNDVLIFSSFSQIAVYDKGLNKFVVDNGWELDVNNVEYWAEINLPDNRWDINVVQIMKWIRTKDLFPPSKEEMHKDELLFVNYRGDYVIPEDYDLNKKIFIFYDGPGQPRRTGNIDEVTHWLIFKFPFLPDEQRKWCQHNHELRCNTCKFTKLEDISIKQEIYICEHCIEMKELGFCWEESMHQWVLK